jgi:hypothetical protein
VSGLKRRDLLILGASAAIARPLAARAQQKAMPVIGYLNGTSAVPGETSLAAFRQGLSETGYVEGQNLAIEYRWAMSRYDRLPGLAADLVARKVDVIAATGGSARAQQKTQPRRSRLSSPEAATRSQTAWSPVSPCQWIRLGSSMPFSTRTRNGWPTSVVMPNVPSGWRMP